uniref:beta strand repeat-containing protein n=1 Tax=Nevskia soli TaxID=418856 RepID=UPI0015D89CF7
SSMYPKTTFYYAVSAFDAAGNSSAQSAAIAVTTLPDTTLPTAPASLVAVAQGPQQVALSWPASTDDVKVAGYSISRGKTPTSMISVGTTTSTSLVDTSGLSAAQTYYYTVSAFDEASNYSTPSPMATVTTLPVTTPPTVSLQTSASPSAIGQTVTFTATIRLTSGTIPNGETVAFANGSTQIGSGKTSGGVATFSTAALAVGSNLVTANYPGDGVYQAATSPALNQVVSKNATTATVTSSANPASYGQSVTFSALVTSTGAVPTGSVTFKSGSAAIGSGTLAGGVATLSTTTLATGTNAISVSYGGDAYSLTSTSANLSQVENDSTITLALKSSANPSAPNQQVTFTGTLTIPNGGNPTGTITFSQNGAVIGSPVTVASRQASISTSFSATGTYGISAVYSGDVNFTSASAPALSEVIAAGTTTTSVQTSGSPAAISAPVTITATIHSTSGTVPNGELVTFNDGATVIGTGVTAGGIAAFTSSTLAAGTHSITAAYAGDANFAPSTSKALSQTISKNTTTTALTSNLNPSSYEQSVTFAVTASSTGVTPTGTVTLKNGATTIGSITLANGVGTFSTATLATGSNSITAAYGGDASSASSTSAVLHQVVSGSTITLALKSSANPSTPNQQITFTGTLTVPNGGNPTGTITFSQNGSVIGSPVTVASRQASISTSFSATGTYGITAVYSGDSNFSGASAPAVSQTVAAASTTTTVKSSVSPAVVGTPVTFTAAIHPATGTVPNGEVVTFTDGTTALGTGATAGGIATFTTSSLAVGSHSITASYAGDANFSPSTSVVVSETIIKNTTTAAVTSNLNPSTYGQAVTLTAAVSSPGATPTGTVTFKNGTTSMGQVTLVNGVGTLTTATLSAGTSLITVVYSGDGASSSSTSPALSQVVNIAPTATVIGSSLNPSTSGQSVKFTATVTSSNGTPTGTVTFTQGATTLGTATLVGGNAGLSTTALASGSDVITATYNGTASFAGSSATFNQNVN